MLFVTFYVSQQRSGLKSYWLGGDVNLLPPYLEEAKQVDESHGNVKRGTPHDELSIYGPLVKVPSALLANRTQEQVRGAELVNAVGGSANPSPTRLLLNVGLTPKEAEDLIKEGKIDAAVFGMLWITNPDLYKRVEHNQELSTNVNLFGLYNFHDNPSEGYTDYPTSVAVTA
jgi:2,4-dienoyl-CoA reductase-like NADH-dependent reductase (Old Yellow Enzyme family)